MKEQYFYVYRISAGSVDLRKMYLSMSEKWISEYNVQEDPGENYDIELTKYRFYDKEKALKAIQNEEQCNWDKKYTYYIETVTVDISEEIVKL